MANDVTALSTECKNTLLLTLAIKIVDEDLRPNAANTIFTSKHPNWLGTPAPKITTISSLAVETLKFITTDYTQNLTAGTVTFTGAMTDLVRAEYTYFPLTDAQLIDVTTHALQEVSVLTYRYINSNDIATDYKMPICKRLYTNILKSLLLEAKDFFSVSVAGRVINKTNIVSQITAIIEENEKQLQDEINILRTFNKTNRLLSAYPVVQTLNSDSKIS